MKRLRRHSTWGIYRESTKTLQQFTENFVPEMKLSPKVSEDVVKAFYVIRNLLIHSYYEYEFVDVAANKLLQTFEMALKIRYEEVNGQAWPKKGPNSSLQSLLYWFGDRNYFENSERGFLDHVRKVRNYFAHPVRHYFGGIALFHWFDTVTDLVNDLYQDIPLRKSRLEEQQIINRHLAKIIENGAIVDLVTTKVIIYQAGVYFVDNIGPSKKIYGFYKTIFKPHSELAPDERRSNPLGYFELENYRIETDPLSFGGEMIRIYPLDKLVNIDRYNAWKDNYVKDEENQRFNDSVSFQLQQDIKKKRRPPLVS